MRGTELTTYIWVYNSVRICELPWESAWTWVLCMVGVDHGYYWVHRMGHGKCQCYQELCVCGLIAQWLVRVTDTHLCGGFANPAKANHIHVMP